MVEYKCEQDESGNGCTKTVNNIITAGLLNIQFGSVRLARRWHPQTCAVPCFFQCIGSGVRRRFEMFFVNSRT
jgi:hypothetical protein